MFERPRRFPHGSVCAPLAILWAYPAATPLLQPRHIVSREILNSLSIHLSRSLLFRPRATRDLLSKRIAFAWTRVGTLPVDIFSHTGALAHGFPPSGEVYPSHAIFWCGSRERAGGRGMESAAGLIGSQPCDIHCLLGASQGTGDNWVDSLGGCISGGGWHSCGDFFSFFLLGMGRRRRGGADHTLVPATPEPTPRA